MSIETLESLLKNPDIWDIELSTQNMRDVLIEIASRVDHLTNQPDRARPSTTDKSGRDSDDSDFRELDGKIENLSKLIERQNTDFSAELKDIQALFNFQLRDIRERIDRSPSPVKADDVQSRSATPLSTAIEKLPEQLDDSQVSAELENKLHSLSKDVSYLKENMREIITSIQNEVQNEIKPIEVDGNGQNETSAIEEIKPIEEEKITSDPASPIHSARSVPVKGSKKGSKDPRVDEIREIIELMRKERKTDVERLNSTIKVVNQLITEKENTSKQLSQCLHDSKGFTDEFERLYQKMAEVQLEVDKKLADFGETHPASRLSTPAKDLKGLILSSNGSSSELIGQAQFDDVVQKMQEGFKETLATMDNNYLSQIAALKQEIVQLKTVLQEHLQIPSELLPTIEPADVTQLEIEATTDAFINRNGTSGKPSRPLSVKSQGKARNEIIEVQTDQSISSGIPVRVHEQQNTTIANEISSQVIVSRTPIQFFHLVPEYKKLLDRLSKLQQAQAVAPAPVKQQARVVKKQKNKANTTNIKVQTADEEAEQPDANPPPQEKPVIEEKPKEKVEVKPVEEPKPVVETKPVEPKPAEPRPAPKKKKLYVDSTTETLEELSGIPSPLRTPNRSGLNTPIRPAHVYVDIVIETDPEITQEPIGITPDLLILPASPVVEYRSGETSTSTMKQPEKYADAETTKEKVHATHHTKKHIIDTEETPSTESNEIQDEQTTIEKEIETTISNNEQENIKEEEYYYYDDEEEETEKQNQNENEEEKENEVKTEEEVQSETTEKVVDSNEQKEEKTETETSEVKEEKPASPHRIKRRRRRRRKPKEENAKKDELQINKVGTEVKQSKPPVDKNYSDSGISTQINTYEKEDSGKRYIRHSESNFVEEEELDETVVMLIDIEIQTDDITDEELEISLREAANMTPHRDYRIFVESNKIPLVTKTTTAQSKSYVSTYNDNEQNRPVFGFEHMLNLTILSNSKVQDQQIVVNVPTSATCDGNLDVASIVNKVVEMQNQKNYDQIKSIINEHSIQIADLFNYYEDLKNPNMITMNDNDGAKRSANGQRRRLGHKSNTNSTASLTAVPANLQSQSALQLSSENLTDLNQSEQNEPEIETKHIEYVPQAVMSAEITECLDSMKNRLNQYEVNVAALEKQFYNLEKGLINKGAMRPNSATLLDDEVYANLSQSMYIRNNDDDNDGSRKRHHHRKTKHESSAKDEESESEEKRRSLLKTASSEEVVEDKEETNNNNTQPGPTSTEKKSAVPNSTVTAMSSTPEKKPSYYNQFTPGQLSKEAAENGKKEQLDFLGGFTIDPDPVAQPQQEQVKLEDLSIPKYERQFRLLREAVVELRTNIQILRVKTDQPVIIQAHEEAPAQEEVQEPKETERSIDESTIRSLRRKMDMKLEDYASQIQEIRRELYQHLEKPPDRIIEVRTEVRTIEKPKDEEEEGDGSKAPPAPKEINVDLNLSRAIEMLSDTQHKNVISIHRLEMPPDVKEHRDPLTASNSRPIIENPTVPNAVKPVSTLLPHPSSPKSQNPRQSDASNDTLDYTALPPPSTTPIMKREKLEGHVVPQIVQDMRVLNAMPKKDMLELLMPFLYEMRAELLTNIDTNTERIRCLETSMKTKVEKEFIEIFFRKIRLAVQEADEKGQRACNFLVDKVSRQDLEDRIQELLKQIGTQETMAAGKTNFTCLFCGAKRTSLGKGASSLMEKGKIFKGRASLQSTSTSENSQLPMLNESQY